MPVREYEPYGLPVHDAEESLLIIRQLMERSTKHSTFSGLSGVLAGVYAISGCLIQWLAFPRATILFTHPVRAFLALWSVVVLLAIGTDFILTKRKAVYVGKTIRSRLGQQMFLASVPGLGTGALLTLFLSRWNAGNMLVYAPPFWMLCYGSAVCSVGLFSQREVSRLGWAFLIGGALTLGMQILFAGSAGSIGLAMTGLTFGGLHIVYGIAVSRRDGW